MTIKLTNLDASENAFFARELEAVKRRTFDVLYPDLKSRAFIPASAEPAPSGAESHTYRQFDHVGMAKIIANYASDLPRVDVLGTEFTAPVKSVGASFGYNLQEIRASMMANRDLPGRKARAARQVMEEELDSILATGNAAAGLTGFVNNANVPTATVVGGTWATKATTNPDLILFDITDQMGDMLALTKGREMPDSLILPISQFVILAQTRLVDRDRTLLEHVKASMPWLKNINHWYRLTGAGAGATDRMVMYKKDPDKVYCEVPQEFEMLEVQVNGLEYEVPCHLRVGGTVFPYPLSASYRDGI